MQKALWVLIVTVLGLGVAASSAKADILGAGGSGAPDMFTLGFSYDPPPGQPARTVKATNSANWGSGSLSGESYEQVESDPGNVFCPGCLDFIFQLQNNGTSAENITEVSEAGFGAYSIDVGYDLISVGSATLCGPDDNGFCNNGNPSSIPNNVSSVGGTVGFNFGGITPANSTVDLVIETNATSYTDPLMTVYGSKGDTATLTLFGPSGPPVTTPEGSTLLLLAFGLFALLPLQKCSDRRHHKPFDRSRIG